MSTRFDASFDFLMKLEGGFKLHEVEGDRGGQTYAGIARRFNPDWAGWSYIDKGEAPPVQLVKEFYFKHYWQPCHCAEFQAPLDCSLFCCAVNMGTKKAAMLLQSSINYFNGSSAIKVDGAIGPQTVSAAQEIPPRGLLSAFTVAKIARYYLIVSNDKSQRRFLLGWISRALAEQSFE